jgi:hypothetical protein
LKNIESPVYCCMWIEWKSIFIVVKCYVLKNIVHNAVLHLTITMQSMM